MRTPFLHFLLVLIIGTSCGNLKKVTYLQNKEGEKADSLYKRSIGTYRVQSGDILFIRVISPDEEVTKAFENPTQQSNAGTVNSGYFYIYGYPVNPMGIVEVPILGNLYVSGMTMSEIQKLLQEKASQYLINSDIVVRLAGFNVSVMGEVKAPGRYTVFGERLTIMDALSMAGDITYYGKRMEVMVVRSTPEGNSTYTIDLTDKAALASSSFYLAPNDIIVVKPVRMAIVRLRLTELSGFLGAVSSILSITSIILLYRL